MDDLSFTTFLKVALTPTTQGKLGQIQKLHSGAGGYDFYKRMKLAAREVARAETPSASIIDERKTIKREAERIHNVEMASRFVKWWNDQEGAIADVRRPLGSFKTASMPFAVRLAPELVYERDATKYVTYLWATRAPKLTKQGAGIGLLMLRNSLAKGEFAEHDFQILDLRNKKVFSVDCINNQTSTILQADIA
jgi:hypothetical protein